MSHVAEPRKRACGTWPSPVTALDVTESVTVIEDVIVDSSTRAIYHIERRPIERNRSALLASATNREIVDRRFDVKTYVNSYGKAAASIHNGLLYFNNVVDHRVYRQSLPSATAIPITPAHEPFRFAFFVRHPRQIHIIFTVKEDHANPSPHGIVTTLAYIDSRSATVHTVAKGRDFYSSPSVNASGTKLAWLEWDHPHTPWKGAQLVVADIHVHSNNTVSIYNRQVIAGDPGRNGVHQFIWCPPDYDSTIIMAWDKGAFCEPWIYTPGGRIPDINPMYSQPNTIGCDFADPSWYLDEASFIFLEDKGQMLWIVSREGRSVLNYMDFDTGDLVPIPTPYVEISRLRKLDNCSVVFIGSTATRSRSLVKMTIDRQWATPPPSFDILFAPPEAPIDLNMIPTPKTMKIPKRNGQFTFAHYYPPANPRFAPLDGEKPPCLLSLHPYPTSRTEVGFLYHRTYYTSRGFAWLDIDTCGSTGYGKDYRDRINGRYGEEDILDIYSALEYLNLSSIYDPNRVILRCVGRATYPALQTLIKYPNLCLAASLHFISADMIDAAREIPDKATMYYILSLMGGSPDEIPQIYRSRNPIVHADRITAPLLITHKRTSATFNQSQSIVNTLSRLRRRVEHIFYEPSMSESLMMEKLFDRELIFFENILRL